jgi:predicted lipoprotein with Yx(FWY)xxD motif
MNKKRTSLIGGAVVIAAAVVIAVAALASASSSNSSAATVKTGHALGKTVLVNRAGRTLYSLSAETNGRFICTGACVTLWHPLVVGGAHKPTGARSLSTVRRPGGQTQVTYKGKPLYTFTGDHKRGDATGEGFKDVGVWHAAVVGASKAPASDPTPDSGGGGGGGYYGY